MILGASVFVAFAFALSWPVRASTIPETLSLVAHDTTRVIEKDVLASWYTVGQKTVYDTRYTREIESPQWSCVQYPFFCEGLVPRSVLVHVVTTSTFAVQETKVREVLVPILEELEREPINAKLGMGADKELIVVSEAVPGISLDQERNMQNLITSLTQNRASKLRIELATETTPAKVSRETIAKLGIHDLIAEGKTDFTGSPKNRVFNIHRALEQYDGIVIAPGEEFSFVDYLGEVDGEHGYLPELVIRNNKTEPEFGGGICQVSTTIFRAAIYAGLEITDRKNHSYPVQYYKPYGFDATIYIPRPDLKFKNNTPGAILVLPTIKGMELTFRFYGTRDGRTTTVDGPHILESNPDGSMRTIFTQTVKDKDGNTLINATFPSNYKSPALFPHPGDEILTEKPKNWSSRQWKEYKAIRP